ncbi:MAG: hypothetical protein QME51_08300 [Planctomycetota bacterium]|nr:hypothetical protein [Planctomycetota bacterium]
MKYIILLIIFILLSLLSDLLLPHDLPRCISGWWHKLPGFEIIYGFIGCIVIIIVAKLLARLVLQKRED